MALSRPAKLDLSDLKGLPKLSEGKVASLIETSFWCINHCGHCDGTTLRLVDNGNEESFVLCWPAEQLNLEKIYHSYNQDDAVEQGAEAVAFLLAIERTDYSAIRRAVTGTGIDYWLGYEGLDPNKTFHDAGRLEVSGIMKETPKNSVNRRVNIKLKQTVPTDRTMPVFIIVVEFSNPWAIMVTKNVNS